jgi:hypothetical protein
VRPLRIRSASPLTIVHYSLKQGGMPMPQPSRQHNKQITLIMKNNHLKIAVNKEPKCPPKGGEKIIPCKLKMLSIGAGLAAGTLFGSCQKNEDTPPIQQHDTEIYYVQGRHQDIAPEVIKNHTDSSEVRHLYIVPVIPNSGSWTYDTDAITTLINKLLKPAMAVSSKVKGKGPFYFENPVLPADSLWLVQQGWTVNQR